MRFKRLTQLSAERRGVILMVVLALLTLFAIVGITFVLYATSEATAARVAREGETLQAADMDPEQALAMFLGQLIYDVPDDITGAGSALRGHSFARTEYGFNYQVAGGQVVPLPANAQAYNGVGRLHYPGPVGVDDYQMVNYTWFLADGFIRDPERFGTRGSPFPMAQTNPFVGANAPYTYPDLNSFFLAAVKADGTVLAKSFHRDWLFNPGMPLNNMSNPNWTNKAGKYLTARPRPADHNGFPAPGDANGDVKNLPWGPGGNDSIWIDIGAPVMTAPDGTKYKMLVAPLIIDLDGRINLGVAGNILGNNNNDHRSNQGWGGWEMNLAKVLYADSPGNTSGAQEYKNLFFGNPMAGAANVWGKYGADRRPSNSGGIVPSGNSPHFYSMADFNGVVDPWPGAISSRVTPPGFGPPPPINSCFPVYTSGYNNGGVENTDHPLRYDIFRALTYLATNDDRVFRASDMEALLRPNLNAGRVDIGAAALASDLIRLCPTNFGPSAPSVRYRNLVTTLSMDLGQPGLLPYWYNPPTPYVVPAGATAPSGANIPFPPVPPTVAVGNTGTAPMYTSEFGVTNGLPDWRAVDAALGRIRLNRPLPPYPHMGTGLMPPYTAPSVAYGNQINPADPQFQAAQSARQTLANDIYRRLTAVTGVGLPNPPTAPLPTDPNLIARRWLAQLAVNIVDFIDEDDISTPFNFYTNVDAGGAITGPQTSGPDPDVTGANPNFWVFGVEMPRVVINEVVAETPTVPLITAALPNAPVNVWVELYNPMQPPPAPQPTIQAQDYYRVPFYINAANGNPAYSPYRITLSTGLMNPPLVGPNANVLGKPAIPANWAPPLPKSTANADFSVPPVTIAGPPQPPNNTSNPPVAVGGIDPGGPGAAAGSGYFLLAPTAVQVTATFKNPLNPTTGIPGPTPVLRVPSGAMGYTTNFVAGSTTDERTTGLTVLLRRLANPYLPFNPNPVTAAGQPNPVYNPYMTTDYIEKVPLNASTPATNSFSTRAKRQPYASRTLLGATLAIPANGPTANTAGAGALTTNGVTHTFGLQNVPLPQSGHYDWLVHLDRQLISPMELLHVCAYQPYQLTQQFMIGPEDNPNAASRYRHCAPWLDQQAPAVTFPWYDTIAAGQSHRLYRLFDFLESGDRGTGVYGLGRIPGRVNINTIWDPEIWQAICDGNPSIGIPVSTTPTTAGDPIYQIFQALLQSRSPNYLANATNDPTKWVGPVNMAAPAGYSVDRPFMSLGVGAVAPGGAQFPVNGLGVADTILRQSPGSAAQLLLLQNPTDTAAATHPYLQTQLLSKVYNNLTTRSNVFAVWMTVGFFQVTSTATTPPTLGPEIGLSEGRQIRHRMFAIVDRTNLQTFATTYNGAAITVTPATGPQTPNNLTFNPSSGTNTNTNLTWTIQAGTTLVFEPGTDNEETVVLQGAGPFSATFYKSHAQGVTVAQRGNPGPWLRYDPRQDPAVVPYYSIIE